MAFAGETLEDMQQLLRTVGPSSSSAEHPSATSSSASSSAESSLASDSSSDSSEFTTADYPGVLDTDLTSLTPAQRVIFSSLVAVLFLLSVGGNVGTLFVNYRRKIRPFFRACLISLACSDLLGTVFMSMAYLSQVNAEYVQIWRLGSLLCSVLPFCTTTAILASSMTLVGIALDRYFAVMKAVAGFWNPGALFCGLCMALIWGASMGIACPVICIYATFPVYILTEETATTSTTTTTTTTTTTSSDEDLSYTLVREQELVLMCVSHQRNVALYYAIVFGIIFTPCIGAFIWLNSVIAKKLWIRRHTVTRGPPEKRPRAPVALELRPPCDCHLGHSLSSTMPSSLALTMGGGPLGAPEATTPTIQATPPANNPSPASSSRESRHIRMFTIVLLLMAAFLFFRLPTWIFLIMRMYGTYSRPVHWILYFSFGVLNLASCVLNPLFYTFLAETIQYAMFVKVKLFDDFCGLRLCCGRGARRESRVPSEAGSTLYGGCQSGPPTEPQPSWLRRCLALCACCGAAKAAMSYSGGKGAKAGAGPAQASPVAAKQPVAKDDADEGVECSDASDGEGDAGLGEEFSRRIYTIYPMSLVSSSMGSE